MPEDIVAFNTAADVTPAFAIIKLLSWLFAWPREVKLLLDDAFNDDVNE